MDFFPCYCRCFVWLKEEEEKKYSDFFSKTVTQSRLNYEEQNQHSISIRFSNSEESIERAFSVDIEDTNESPYGLQCSILHRRCFCTASDDDFNQTLKIEMKSFNQSHVEIICIDNGQPPLAVTTWIKVLPDDMTIILVPLLSLMIPVGDDNNKIDKQTDNNIVIFYSNEGDKPERQRRQANSPPQDIHLNMFHSTIPENSRDWEIASVQVVDQNKNNYTCSMYTHHFPDDRQPFEIKNGILRTSALVDTKHYNLDFEDKPVYNITISCSDPIHRFTIVKNCSLALSDVNEAPTQLTITPDTFPENAVAEYVIGRFHTIDPDVSQQNQTFEYKIVTDANRIFRIKNDQLILSRDNNVQSCISHPQLCPHDYEQIGSALIRVSVEDRGQPRASQTFWLKIKITDENDPPVNLKLSANLVHENSPIGTLVGEFSVQDEDAYQTHTFTLLHGDLFVIENNLLRLAQSPDYEQGRFQNITVQAVDNGTPPRNITRNFRIEIVDVDELPDTYAFVSNVGDAISNATIEDLINGKQSQKIFYLPKTERFHSLLGRIVFLIEDRNRDIDLYGYSPLHEFKFFKPTCRLFTENPYRLLCQSLITVSNPNLIDHHNGHLICVRVVLKSNSTAMRILKPLRIIFGNIILTINNEATEFIDIPKHDVSNFILGPIQAIDLVDDRRILGNVTLNADRSLSYPLEIVNSTILKVLDGVTLSSVMFNVSVFITVTHGNDSRIIEKSLIICVKDKNSFDLKLSNNKIMENSPPNTFVGHLILTDGFGNYSLDLTRNGSGRFQLNGTRLLSAGKYLEGCRINHSCPFNHEREPIIDITVAVCDPSTNQTLRLITFPIEVDDENEGPYNLTLSTQSVPEDTPIGSNISTVHAMDDDLHQILTYTTDNPTVTLVNNQLRLTKALNYADRKQIPVIIRATDNGRPSIFTDKFFLINVTKVNQLPTDARPDLMTVSIPQSSKGNQSTPLVVGQLYVKDPDDEETFNVTFDKPQYRATVTTSNTQASINDKDLQNHAHIYNITVADLNPPVGFDKGDYSVNVTANITDSGNHTIPHAFVVSYISEKLAKVAVVSTSAPLTTTTPASLSQALHIGLSEITPEDTPIVRALLSASSSNTSSSTSPTCTAIDDQARSFPINTTNAVQAAFIIYLPENYTLNATSRPTILLRVQCDISNDTIVQQDIVLDVLPAPPPIKINFNQTQPFYVTNNTINNTILAIVSYTELTNIPTNRTYNLSLVNNRDTFQLRTNGSFIQIGSYPSDPLQFDNPHVNLTFQVVETTPNEPTRVIRTTFSIPLIVNSSVPSITFSRSSIPNDTTPNTTIGNFTVHNLSKSYQLQLVDTYDNGLELNPNTSALTLKRLAHTFPLINNQTQLPITIALINQSNGTILTATIPLTITYPTIIKSCLNKTCGNGSCISLNDNSSYCLCTSGYTGLDCQVVDPCAYNPCVNNGVCHQSSSSTADFTCRCLPNYSGSLCQIAIDVCQSDASLCPSTDICISLPNNLTSYFTCIPRDELQYLVFDNLNSYKTVDVINDEDLMEKIEDFIQNNLLSIENIVLLDRKILGPYLYDRAELISVAILPSNEHSTSLNDALNMFCANYSFFMVSFAREMCAGYQQAVYLDNYFNSTPDFCPNCTFIDAADKYYWFDNFVPLIPLWIALILGALLMMAVPLIPLTTSTPKKFSLPLMKAKIGPEEHTDNNELESSSVLASSVRSAAKTTRYSSRERNDSGYESNEESESYLEQIVAYYQAQHFQVYPVLHSTSIERQRNTPTTEEPVPTNTSSPPQLINSSSVQRSASMAAQKPRQQPSSSQTQSLKPIIQSRSTLFDSTIGSLIRSTGSPRLNQDEDSYISTRFRNENTSKFVIGTLWNTFALVNNLFLQRPRKRRDAIADQSPIDSDAFAHLHQLYAQTERDQQAEELAISNLHSIISDISSNPEKTNNTDHLQSIISEVIASTRNRYCDCYGNHHRPSCVYYDHSLPYLKYLKSQTSELEKIFSDVQKANKPNYRDVATQSQTEKSNGNFTRFKSTIDVATQSSPSTTLVPSSRHVSTQYSYTDDRNYISINDEDTPYTINKIPPGSIVQTKSYDDHIYVNVSTQYSPEVIPNRTISTQFDSKISPYASNLPFNELTQISSSSISKKQITKEEQSPPPHTVRNLVSKFETTSPTTKTAFPHKSPPNSTSIHVEPRSSPVHNVVEQYAEDISSNVINKVLSTVKATNVFHDEQRQQKRFSFYNNAGGHGKTLLFQSNTFLPLTTKANEEIDPPIRVESKASSTTFLNDPPTLVNLNNTLTESRHTLIVGRCIDGDDVRSSSQTKKKHRNIRFSAQFESNSSSSSENDEVIDHQHLLSNSQLLSAQQLYIEPWLVRRATASDIHCLDVHIDDTRIETNLTETFFSVFPRHHCLDLYTRYTCLVTILLFLCDVHDENSNQVLYDELEQLEKQLVTTTTIETSPKQTHSNVFQTINPDGSKRYRTGVVLDVNSSEPTNVSKISVRQVEWKRVKLVVRRFRKKYLHYKQLMKNDTKKTISIESYFKYFDSVSKHRIKKYAKHYAEKI